MPYDVMPEARDLPRPNHHRHKPPVLRMRCAADTGGRRARPSGSTILAGRRIVASVIGESHLEASGGIRFATRSKSDAAR